MLRRIGPRMVLLAASVTLAEILLRLLAPLPHGYFVLPPGVKEEFHLPAAMMVDVPAVARHSTNAQGVRAEPLGQDRRYRILAIGGSTTACGVLDASQTWPFRLQTLLAQRAPHLRPWVGNLGKDGLNTRHHLVTMSRFLPQHPIVDTVLLLAGVNDLLFRLARDENHRSLSTSEIENDPETLARAFVISPPQESLNPWFRQFGFWRLASRLAEALRARGEPALELVLAASRARRHGAILRSKLPDLEPALQEYERNLDAIVERGRSLRLRMILLTQPVLWKHSGMTAEEEAVLMFGFVGPSTREAKVYYSASALADGMALFNESTRSVCRRKGIECVDLAAALKGSLSVLYDDCHFNISGAERVAQLIAAHLTKSPPFSAEAGLAPVPK